jgi:hypothetical protein
MKHFVLAIALLFSLPSFSQSTQVNFDTAKARLSRRDADKALPVFQELMATADAATKRIVIDYLTEHWVDASKGGIALSKSVTDYARLVSAYVAATFTGKESGMNANDRYTAGMIYWALAYSGMKGNELKSAINQLGLAAQQGHVNASYYLAEAASTLKTRDPGVSWDDVLDLYTRASMAKKSPRPLIKFGNNRLNAVKWSNSSKDKKAADLDTARNLFGASLNNIIEVIPDSFHVAIDYFWSVALQFDSQDTSLTNLLTSFFIQRPIPPTSPAKKGLAWNYLYQFFYDDGPKNDTLRGRIMNGLKQYYNNDRELLAVITEFLDKAEPNDIGYAKSVNSKWLSYFTPMQVSDPERFFKAAAFTEQDYRSFLEKNAPANRFANAIAQGYRDRFDILFSIATGKVIADEYKFSLSSFASGLSMRVIEKLKTSYPDIYNNSAVKYVYADLAVLDNLCNYARTGQVPVGFDQLPAAFANWSNNDKLGYKRRYIDFFLKQIQTLVNTGKNNKSLSQATGKTNLDLNDYDKAQATIDRIQAALKTN